MPPHIFRPCDGPGWSQLGSNSSLNTRYCQIKTSLFEGGFGNGFGNNNNIIPCIFGGRSEETSEETAEADIDPGNVQQYAGKPLQLKFPPSTIISTNNKTALKGVFSKSSGLSYLETVVEDGNCRFQIGKI